MKKVVVFLVLLCLASIIGCANFNPRLKQSNNNPNGDIKNNQQGLMLELGNLRKETSMLQSKLKEIQEGLININAAISKNENSGVQILQGDGSLFLIFSLAVIALLFYQKSRSSQEAARILTKKIIDFDNKDLTNSVVGEFSVKNKEKYFLNILKKLN